MYKLRLRCLALRDWGGGLPLCAFVHRHRGVLAVGVPFFFICPVQIAHCGCILLLKVSKLWGLLQTAGKVFIGLLIPSNLL